MICRTSETGSGWVFHRFNYLNINIVEREEGVKLNEWLVGGNKRLSPSEMPTSSDASGQKRSVVLKKHLKKS